MCEGSTKLRTPAPNRRMQFESKWIKVREINTHYLIGGEGPPLVLIHGGGAASAESDWESNLEFLAHHYRVYAPDLVGYGKSDKPRLDYTTRFFNKFFDDYMTAMGLERTNLLGHSLGGGVALAYALNHPDRVEKLVLVDSAGLTNELGLVGKLLHPIFTRVARLKGDHVYVSLMTGGSQREPSELFTERLHELKAPTLIVWGEWDGYIPVKLAYLAHERIKDSKLHVFENCWHDPQRRKPGEFNRLVLDFLKQ